MNNRDWTEDSKHENGNYTCACSVCGKEFMGHKRRVVCKACSGITDPITPSDKDLQRMWLECGGEIYGPNVETGAMPVSRLFPFLRGLINT